MSTNWGPMSVCVKKDTLGMKHSVNFKVYDCNAGCVSLCHLPLIHVTLKFHLYCFYWPNRLMVLFIVASAQEIHIVLM